ncbi:hypothetical protein D3C74_399410 [compost metagenome]
MSVFEQINKLIRFIIHRLEHLRQGKLLHRSVTVLDFDLVRLVDLINHHRSVLPLNFCRQIGIGNLGVHHDGIHMRVAHHHAAFAVHPGREHNARSLYRIRFAEKRHHRI